MTDDRPPVDAPSPPAAVDADPEDPLAADRRTLTIGAVAMVGLILVGVVSAQLFARGGCAAIVEPRPAAVRDAPADPIDVVGAIGVDAAATLAAIETVAGAPVAAAVAVGDATGVVPLDDGMLTTGPSVTGISGALAPAATLDATGRRVVGDGTTVYDVTVPNEATGQTDALVPLTGPELEVGTCVDTAVVGSPFAFLLDAGDGQLLLLRADEDGDRPDLQLRDADTGAVWNARLTLPGGPPGTLAERTSARLGPDTVVAARRVGPQETDPTPALVAVDRSDGEVRFEVDHDQLAAAAQLDPDDPIRWQVVTVGSDTALVHGHPDPTDGGDDTEVAEDGALVLLDLAEGDAVTAVTGVGPVTSATVSSAADTGRPDRHAFVTATVAGGGSLGVLVAGGDLHTLEAVSQPVLAWARDLLVADGDAVQRWSVASDAASLVAEERIDAPVAALTETAEGRVAVLVTGRGGGDAVLVVTTRTDDLADPADT